MVLEKDKKQNGQNVQFDRKSIEFRRKMAEKTWQYYHTEKQIWKKEDLEAAE